MYYVSNTPAVVIDLEQADLNIQKMVAGLNRSGIAHRPHTKTHKTLYFARRQLELGASGITCAKVSEAEVMVQGGIKDILIAYPIIGGEKLRRLGDLMRVAELSTVVNSAEGAEGLSSLGLRIGKRVPVLIDIDGGMQRGGLAPFEPALAFAKQIGRLPGIQIVGLMYYNGSLSSCDTKEEMMREAERERDELIKTAELLRAHGFEMRTLSGGSSYSSALPEHLKGITEARAGTYIFGDASLLSGGVAALSDCALRVHATVVSTSSERRFIIDAGSKTLSSDLCGHRPGYGYVCERPEAVISKLNEEHGFVDTQTPHGLRVGDQVTVIPNHCCVVMNLANAAIGTRNGQYERMIRIDARGMNQ